MSAFSKTPWSPPWHILRELSGGGQAATFIVKHELTGAEQVLKKLHRQDDIERRRRMHREVSILQTLNHQRIPRLIESNSSNYERGDILYLVTELIPGRTLSDIVKDRRMSVEEAIGLLDTLLETLQYTHGIGVIHRDIKPDNIILRNDHLDDPVLLDFGLSFNQAEDVDTSLTHSLQQLGNRFLALPELQLKSSLQRDPRSDLTQSVAILFYAITGVIPVTLTDESSRLPHQRDGVQAIWKAINEPTRRRLLRIFDRGFTLNIDQRWQSAQALRRALPDVAKPSTHREEVGTIQLRNLSQRLEGTPEFARRQRIQRHVDQLILAYKSAATSILSELGSDFYEGHSGRDFEWASLKFAFSISIYHRITEGFAFKPLVEGEVTGNEIVVYSNWGEEYVEFIRFPIDDHPNLAEFHEELVRFYKRGLEGVVNTLV